MTKKMNSQHLPVAYALRQALKGGYSAHFLYNDLLAAFVVSLIALPLSMALAIAVGVPPQHGIYTAIIAGIAVALLGGSKYQVSGPTAAFIVILVPIVQQFGLRGLIIAEVMAGIMLVAMAIARFGKLISYVPYPVTTGFTSGIAVVIATLSLNDLMGLGIPKLEGSYVEKLLQIIHALPALHWPDATIGLVSIIILFTWHRILPKIPSVLVMVFVSVVMAYFLAQHGQGVATIGSQFSYLSHTGAVMHGIPPYPPSFHLPNFKAGNLFAWPSYDEFRQLIAPAFVIAMLAALESLLSATVADGLSNSKHNPNAELLGIGIGNILSGLAAGIPATGAIARTATNIRGGAKSPLAAVFHALLIMIYVLLLAPYISYLPMAALASLLFVTAYHMSHYKQFFNILKIAPRHDVVVLVTCFMLTVFVDMVMGVTVGIVLASFLFMKRMSDLTETQVKSGRRAGPLTGIKVPEDALVYRISGPLFFGTAEKALDRAEFNSTQFKSLILDITEVPTIDLTGIVALESILLRAEKSKTNIFLCSQPRLAKKIQKKLPRKLKKSVIFCHSLQEAVKKIQ